MVTTVAWRTMGGRCNAPGRVGARRHGCLSLLLVLLSVGGLRKVVAADCCQIGSDETMSPHHHGDLVEREEESRRRKRLLVRGAPGLSRVGPPNQSRTRKFPAATLVAQALAADSPSSMSMLLDEGNMAGTAWPAICHGSGPGKSTSMDDPPPWGPKKGGQHWEEHEEDDWEEDDPSAGCPAYDALDDTYKTILAKIVALPDEAARQEAIDHFKNQDSPVGKAMLAAFAETMATRQAAKRPVLRHPAGDPAGDMDTLRKEKNKAEQLARQAAALLQRKNLEVLAIQERIAQSQKELVQTQKEQAEAAVLKEERSKDLALKDQQLQAAMAHRERELLQESGAPTVPTVPEPFLGSGQYDEQAQQLLESVSIAVTKLRKYGDNLQPVLDALAPLLGPALAAQSKPAGEEAPPTPPLVGRSAADASTRAQRGLHG